MSLDWGLHEFLVFLPNLITYGTVNMCMIIRLLVFAPMRRANVRINTSMTFLRDLADST